MVDGKQFDIAIVPIRVEELLVQHDKINGEYLGKLKDIEDEETIGDLVNGHTEDCGRLILEMLESLLVANGYEYDQDWWTARVTYSDIIQIIAFSKAKDMISDKTDKKKVTEVKAEA